MLRRAAVAAATATTFVGVAALATACGGDKASADASNRDRRMDAALEWAKCMREHGADVPDPKVGPNGLLRIGPRPGNAERAPDVVMMRASRSCDHLLRRGGPGRGLSATEQRRLQEQALKFARCMREHGIDIPDPKFNSEGGSFTIPLREGEGPGSPAFDKAQQVCEKNGGGPPLQRAP